MIRMVRGLFYKAFSAQIDVACNTLPKGTQDLFYRAIGTVARNTWMLYPGCGVVRNLFRLLYKPNEALKTIIYDIKN